MLCPEDQQPERSRIRKEGKETAQNLVSALVSEVIKSKMMEEE